MSHYSLLMEYQQHLTDLLAHIHLYTYLVHTSYIHVHDVYILCGS